MGGGGAALERVRVSVRMAAPSMDSFSAVTAGVVCPSGSHVSRVLCRAAAGQEPPSLPVLLCLLLSLPFPRSLALAHSLFLGDQPNRQGRNTGRDFESLEVCRNGLYDGRMTRRTRDTQTQESVGSDTRIDCIRYAGIR